MILQALVHYYEKLVEQGKLERPGWTRAKVSWGLILGDDGRPVELIPLTDTVTNGKKTAEVAKVLNVPEQVKRAVNIAANFLCDSPAYIFALDSKGKPERALKCFQASRERHLEILEGVDSPAARAICRYYETWNTALAAENELIKQNAEALAKGGSVLLMYGTSYAMEFPEIRDAWQTVYDGAASNSVKRFDPVTGRQDEIVLLHPAIKNVQGAQPSGASLVSFNARAFESFGNDGAQGLNAPTGKYAAAAYGAALNYLLSDRERLVRIGDSTVVYWSEDGDDESRDMFGCGLTGANTVTDDDIKGWLGNIAKGRPIVWDSVPVDPDNRFYILALAPNAARLSVRFFIQNSFGAIMENLRQHYLRMDIVKPSYDKWETVWLWNMMNETVNQNSRDKSPSPRMTGETLRAILNDTNYPATLFNGVELRIRAEGNITRGKAAIIKAWLLKNGRLDANYDKYREVLTVDLNEQTTYTPYVLGRLFSVFEDLQQAANPGINTTIRDRYFNSACAMPDVVFPVLVNLAQKHIKKLHGTMPGRCVNIEKQITDLTGRITEDYPRHMNLHDQGIFQLGYYHQTQKRYTKKSTGDNIEEEKNNG